MENDLLGALDLLTPADIHPILRIRLEMIRRIVSMVCHTPTAARKLEADLEASEARFDREERTRKRGRV